MPELVILEGLSEALIGQYEDRTVYSLAAIWKILRERDGMTHEDAQEFCSYNIEGLFPGKDRGPIFVEPLEIV